ncbi:type II toxin-antitoxin system VapB family antitoxin [Xylophilus sp. GOD-11R]|uniref:type II toxin-antitoxin system VapB family antitoxin n=1 Tax=Xylophilus sp. GOD-11R TaxID=3089814 RepID=UPI00298C23E6|nr:type II toxin-antitoxin system VapB family antitoxin [Xylophilus sp. GOD-11R]WPB57976.1 type II toxin-antitoxin system VapB family antitoxin [Xylophilus sp. GOD-11R]
MRTNIVIDDALMAAAMTAGGFRTKRDAVEEGLRLVARRAAYQGIRALRGKLAWDDGTGGRDVSAAAHTVQEAERPYRSPAPGKKPSRQGGKA